MDRRAIADQVYGIAALPGDADPLGPLVKEALEVIDYCLDTHGCVLLHTSQILKGTWRDPHTFPSCRPSNVSLSFNGGKDCAFPIPV
jgi:FAD synthetase